jgi:hypothetical protein
VIVGVEVPALMETPLTTNEGDDTQSTACSNLQDVQSAGVTVPTEIPLMAEQPLLSKQGNFCG